MTIHTRDFDALRTVLDESVPALLEQHQVPGLAIGLRIGDQTLSLGYGVTNLEHPLPVDADTIFQVGSISKTFVGSIVARLEREGLIDIDMPIAPILEDLGPLDPRITMRHLLTHRSGIDAQYMIGQAAELLADHADDSIQASIAHFAGDELMFDPGDHCSYSGPAFMVAAAVVERLTNRRWVDVLSEHILEPAGMRQTFTTADEAITYRIAAPHDIPEGQARLARDEGWQRHWQLPGWDVPGGGVLSTANELMRYVDWAWSHGDQDGFFRVLGDREMPGCELAYAWRKDTLRGRQVFGHSGLTIGYSSKLTLFPEEKIGYCLLTNSVKGEPLRIAVERLILDTLFGSAPMSPPEPQELDGFSDLEGRYDCGFYGQVELRIRPDGTAFELIALPATPQDDTFTIDPMSSPRLLPDGPNTLSSAPGDEFAADSVAYMRDEAGKVHALRIHERIAKKVS